KIKAERLLVLFNACHSGKIPPNAFGTEAMAEDGYTGSPVPEDTANALLGTGKGRIIITACQEDQLSYFGWADPISIFTQVLVSGLRGTGVLNRGGLISAYDLYTYLYQTVKEEANDRYSQ